MKKALSIAAILAVGSLMRTTPALAQKGGTDIIHLTIEVTMTGEIGSGAVAADHKKQGGAEKQSLEINVAGLAPDTTYDVLAVTTSESNLTTVAQLTTDTNGAASVMYSKKGQGKGKAKGQAVPASLDPVSQVLWLEVSLGGTQTVLQADMTAPDKLQYLIKRALTNDGADEDAAGQLRLKSNGNQEQFRLSASGLDANTSYDLVINETVAGSYITDATGHLNIQQLPGGAPVVLAITDLAIVDGSTNSILSTQLP